MSASVTQRLPALLLGGWLGAGKTTLLNRLLRDAHGRRIAVLVNDFGDVNLDADLIVGAEAGVLQLAGGCLCCSFGDDLLGTLKRVATRDPQPEALVIELSGVALPRAVRSLMQLAPEVLCLGSLVLVDATQIRRQVADKYVGDTAREQLAGADWLAISKADLVDDDEIAPLRPWLARLAPAGIVLPGDASQLPIEFMFGGHDEGRQTPLESSSGILHLFTTQPLRPRRHPGFASRSVPLAAGADLSHWLKALDDPSWQVLRAKARVGDGSGRGRVLQWAAGRGEVVAGAVEHDGGHLVLIGLDDTRLGTLVQKLG